MRLLQDSQSILPYHHCKRKRSVLQLEEKSLSQVCRMQFSLSLNRAHMPDLDQYHQGLSQNPRVFYEYLYFGFRESDSILKQQHRQYGEMPWTFLNNRHSRCLEQWTLYRRQELQFLHIHSHWKNLQCPRSSLQQQHS